LERRSFIKAGIMSGFAATLPIAAEAASPQAAALSSAPPTYYRTATIDHIPIFYREAGRVGAPVILLLHGWPSSSRMYRNLIPLLADKYHVIAPDYPGFGHSGVPPRSEYDYSFDRMGEIVEALLQKLQIESFALYIMDFGGPIGFRLMLKKPGRVTALITQNGPAYPDHGEWWKDLIQYWKDGTPQSREKVREYFTPEAVRQQYVYGVRDVSRIDPDNWLVDIDLLNRPGLDEIHLDMLYDIRKNVPLFKAVHEYFRSYRPPTLIVTGANDEIFPGDSMKSYLADLPDAELHLLDTGHFALEDHCDEIASLMRDFLGRTVNKGA
jgi:pimeloyl-ACP methyl ester carboxylesterase